MAQLLAEKTLKGRTTTKKRGQECILMLIEREAVEPTVVRLCALPPKAVRVACAFRSDQGWIAVVVHACCDTRRVH